MEVLSARSALLSNFEVLTLLRELESDQLARQKTALRIKKEEDDRIAQAALSNGKGKEREDDPTAASTVYQPPIEEVSENLRTVEVQAIQYLTAEYQPTLKQSEASITLLVKKLAPYNLTKAEKLQIVNLAPTQAVELYVIVEEIEDRMGDSMEDVLATVRDSLTYFKSYVADAGTTNAPTLLSSQPADVEEEVYDEAWDESKVHDVTDYGFDDVGEGAGVEGDLEMDDD